MAIVSGLRHELDELVDEHVPGAWLATWLLQIMPLFFFVGGFANLATWQSVRDDGAGTVEFYRKRLRRLLVPARSLRRRLDGVRDRRAPARPRSRGVLAYATIVFVPLWFLAAYLWVVVLVALTARLHERVHGIDCQGRRCQAGDPCRSQHRPRVDRRAPARLPVPGRDAAAHRPLRAGAARPRGLPGQEHSNIYPTNATILGVGVLQAGVAMLLRDPVCTWLGRRPVWKAVVATNAVIMTVFLWHMSGLVAAVGVYEALGGQLLAEPVAAWWAQRPLWLVGPALLSGPLVALFSPFEIRS